MAGAVSADIALAGSRCAKGLLPRRALYRALDCRPLLWPIGPPFLQGSRYAAPGGMRFGRWSAFRV